MGLQQSGAFQARSRLSFLFSPKAKLFVNVAAIALNMLNNISLKFVPSLFFDLVQ